MAYGLQVLLTPGSYYHPWQGTDMVTTKARGAEANTAHFRLAFSTATVSIFVLLCSFNVIFSLYIWLTNILRVRQSSLNRPLRGWLVL